MRRLLAGHVCLAKPGGLGEQCLVRVHHVSHRGSSALQDGAVSVEHVGGEHMPKSARERIGPGRVRQHALGGQGGGQRCGPAVSS